MPVIRETSKLTPSTREKFRTAVKVTRPERPWDYETMINYFSATQFIMKDFGQLFDAQLKFYSHPRRSVISSKIYSSRIYSYRQTELRINLNRASKWQLGFMINQHGNMPKKRGLIEVYNSPTGHFISIKTRRRDIDADRTSVYETAGSRSIAQIMSDPLLWARHRGGLAEVTANMMGANVPVRRTPFFMRNPEFKPT